MPKFGISMLQQNRVVHVARGLMTVCSQYCRGAPPERRRTLAESSYSNPDLENTYHSVAFEHPSTNASWFFLLVLESASVLD